MSKEKLKYPLAALFLIAVLTGIIFASVTIATLLGLQMRDAMFYLGVPLDGANFIACLVGLCLFVIIGGVSVATLDEYQRDRRKEKAQSSGW